MTPTQIFQTWRREMFPPCSIKAYLMSAEWGFNGFTDNTSEVLNWCENSQRGTILPLPFAEVTKGTRRVFFCRERKDLALNNCPPWYMFRMCQGISEDKTHTLEIQSSESCPHFTTLPMWRISFWLKKRITNHVLSYDRWSDDDVASPCISGFLKPATGVITE